MINDDDTSNELDILQGLTSVKISAAQHKRFQLGIKQQAEEAIYDVMNYVVSADDLNSGTNPVIVIYDDEEDIFPHPGIDIG